MESERSGTKGRLIAGLVNFQMFADGSLGSDDFLSTLEFLLVDDLDSIKKAIGFVEKRVVPHLVHGVRGALFLRIVNRWVFETPEFVPAGTPQFGGFVIPESEGRWACSWPIVRTEQGFEIAARSVGYGGEPFRAKEEFRSFRKLYPRHRSR